MIGTAAYPGSLFPTVWKLLRLRLQLTVNTFSHSKLRNKILTVIGLLALAGFAGFIFFLSWSMLGFLRSPQLGQYLNIDPRLLLQAVPALILTAMFFAVMFTSFGVLLQGLYLAGDMDFLVAAPIPMRAVFITKLLQAVLPNFGLFVLFALPILFGLGISGAYNIAYYPLVVLVMAALTLAAAGLSSLLVMAVVRILPPRRAAEILGFIGATAGVICSQLGNLSQTFGRDANLPAQQVNALLALVSRASSPWIPLNWAGRGLVDVGEGRWLSGILLLILTFGLAAFAFSIALAIAERLYYTGWAGMQVVSRKRRAAPVRRPAAVLEVPGLPWAERVLSHPVAAILRKDFTLLRRDLRNLSQLISPLIIGIVFALSILRGGGEPPPGRGEAPTWFMESFRALMPYANLAVSLFVGWLLLGRLSGMSFSREGKNYWMLKASPVSARQLLSAKYLVAYLPTLGMSWLLLLGMALLQHVPAAQLLYMLLAAALVLAGLNGILMAFGATGANFTWDDPRKMNAGGLGCLGQILTIGLLGIHLALFVGPLVLVAALLLPSVYGYAAGLILGAGAALASVLIPLALVEKRVDRLDEA